MNNPLNPFDWLKSAQNWFRSTERSSGFRPYLIFLIIHIGAVIILLSCFGKNETINKFAVNSLYFSICGFILIFAVKAFQDPNFCRSEKHIENVKRLELVEQKGDKGPYLIDTADIKGIPNLTSETKGGKK